MSSRNRKISPRGAPSRLESPVIGNYPFVRKRVSFGILREPFPFRLCRRPRFPQHPPHELKQRVIFAAYAALFQISTGQPDDRDHLKEMDRITDITSAILYDTGEFIETST